MSESFVIFTAEKGHPWIRNIHSKESETWLWLFWQFWHKMSNFLDRKCFTQTSVEKNKHQQTLPFDKNSIWRKINIYLISWFPHLSTTLYWNWRQLLQPSCNQWIDQTVPDPHFFKNKSKIKIYLSIMGKYDLLNLVQGPCSDVVHCIAPPRGPFDPLPPAICQIINWNQIIFHHHPWAAITQRFCHPLQVVYYSAIQVQI